MKISQQDAKGDPEWKVEVCGSGGIAKFTELVLAAYGGMKDKIKCTP